MIDANVHVLTKEIKRTEKMGQTEHIHIICQFFTSETQQQELFEILTQYTIESPITLNRHNIINIVYGNSGHLRQQTNATMQLKFKYI